MRKNFFLGFSCNNHCVFCSQGSLGASSAAPGEPRFDGVSEAAFVGGEPTLSDRLPEFVAAAKKAGVKHVLVQTNGRRLCYPDYARALKTAGVDALEVSLQGSTPAMHDYHTEVPGSWTQTVAGLREAKKAGVVFGVSTVVTRSNFRHLTDVVRLAHHLGASAVRFELAENYGRASAARDRVVPAPELASEAIIPACREAQRLGIGYCAYGKASSPAAKKLFAGMGERNEAPAAAPVVKPAPAPHLAETKVKPKPGLAEIHVREKISGEALRAIFPKLFEETEAHG